MALLSDLHNRLENRQTLAPETQQALAEHARTAPHPSCECSACGRARAGQGGGA